MENDELTDYEPFSDEEIIKIEDIIIKYNEKITSKQKIEDNIEQIKLPSIHKKQISNKKLLKILSKR
mgnify:CR=1 FL=1|tara:strand:+ start:6392 stop:6592 length:201 start_codon:yes stop_codon:yes gene_type:complete